MVGFGILQIFSIGRMTGDRTLLGLDARLAIPMRVLHLEASSASDPKPVRPVSARQPRLVFGLGFVAQLSNPMIFW
jgi:hypothetical protein